MSFICIRIENYFYVRDFALSLVMKKRLEATWKWPAAMASVPAASHIGHAQPRVTAGS